MYMLNMVIILIVMYCNVITAIDKIPTYLLRFNTLVIQRRQVHNIFLSDFAVSSHITTHTTVIWQILYQLVDNSRAYPIVVLLLLIFISHGDLVSPPIPLSPCYSPSWHTSGSIPCDSDHQMSNTKMHAMRWYCCTQVTCRSIHWHSQLSYCVMIRTYTTDF